MKEIRKDELTPDCAPRTGKPEVYPSRHELEGRSSVESLGPAGEGGSTFATTHWSLVLKVGTTDSSVSAAALEQLCRTYWRPIYAFIRYRSSIREDAEDLTQAFFEHLFENGTLKKASEDKGKFRSFLLGVLEKFMANDADRKRAWKRGGRHRFISLNEEMGDGQFILEPADSATPERLFTRNWVAALLNRVLTRLEREYAEKGQQNLFRRLEPALAQVDEEGFYQRCATELGKTENALKVAMHRLRQRYRELLLSEVAQTVSHPAEVEEELRFLFTALGE